MPKTIKVPLEDLPSVMRYPRTYLRNKFNLRIGALEPFFDPKMFERCFYPSGHPKCYNPLNQLTLTFDQELNWAGDMRPRFWHFDLGVREDPAAVVCAYIDSIDNLPLRDEQIKAEELSAHVGIDFLLEADPEKWPDKTVVIRDLRQLIWHCQRKQMLFGLITFDGWQSEESIQNITRAGVRAGRLSIDSTTTKIYVDREINKLKRISTGNPGAAMENLWLLAREKRLHLPYFPQLVEEAKWQQQDEKTKKVYKMAGASDNIIQAVAGACFNAIVNIHLSWYAIRHWKRPLTKEQRILEAQAQKRHKYYYDSSYASELGYKEQGHDDTGIKGSDQHQDPFSEFF